MKLTIDTTAGTLTSETESETRTLELYSNAAFQLLSQQWVKIGWNQKYPYTFSWLGRPIVQLPEDMIRVQEVIYRVRPDVIIETGVALGDEVQSHAQVLANWLAAMPEIRAATADFPKLCADNRIADLHLETAGGLRTLCGRS